MNSEDYSPDMGSTIFISASMQNPSDQTPTRTRETRLMSLPEIDLDRLLEQTAKITQIAGEKILDVYNSDFTVSKKNDQSPVTLADIQAHECIVALLQDLTPEFPVLSEESMHVPFNQRKDWHRYWLVDPLDGTREFVNRNGEFTINIALIENHVPILGIVYVPVEDCHYSAHIDMPAKKTATDGTAMHIRAKKTSLENMTIACSRSHSNSRQSHFMELFPQAKRISLGSSWKLCLVAEGKCDIYPRFGATSEWDTAAAQCIIQAAGGALTGMNLKPLSYNTRDSLINPPFLAIADSDFRWDSYLKQLPDSTLP